MVEATWKILVSSITPGNGVIHINGSNGKHKLCAEIPETVEPPMKGLLIQATGNVDKRDKWHVLKTTSWTLADLSEQWIIPYIKIQEGTITGLGRARIKLIARSYQATPNRLIRALSGLLRNELDILLGIDVANELRSHWKNYTYKTQAYRFLREKGLTLTESDCLLRLYGNQALAAVKSDPYLLTPIIGFERAEKISDTISTNVTSGTRLSALCTWMISEYTRETGSSLISETELKKRLSKFTKSPVEAIAAGRRGLQLKQTRRLITTSAFHQMETHIRQWLTDIEAADELNFHNYEINNELDLYTSIQRIVLSVEQRNAISLTLTQNITCIDIRSKDTFDATLEALKWVFNRLIGGKLFTFSPDPNAALCICTEELQKEPPDIPKNSLIIIEGSSALDVPSAFKLTKLKITNSKLVFIGNSALSNSAGYGDVYHQAIKYFPTSEIAGDRHCSDNKTEHLSGTPELIAKKVIDKQYTVACYSSEDAIAINQIVQAFKHPNLLMRYITINEMPFYKGDPVIFTNSVHDLGIYRGQRATFEDKKGLFLNFKMNGKQLSLTYHQAIAAGLRLGYAILKDLAFSDNNPIAIIHDKTIKKDKKATTQRLVPVAF